jgi:hypothetical protein
VAQDGIQGRVPLYIIIKFQIRLRSVGAIMVVLEDRLHQCYIFSTDPTLTFTGMKLNLLNEVVVTPFICSLFNSAFSVTQII